MSREGSQRGVSNQFVSPKLIEKELFPISDAKNEIYLHF
jgi:hypothetical protein